MNARLLLFVGATLAFWLLVALPARWLGGGNVAVLHSGTAALLCLVPGLLALFWAGLAGKQPGQQLTIALGSTSLRLFLVLGVTFLLEGMVPVYRGSVAFWVWVLVFYLFTLTVETGLLLAGKPDGFTPLGPRGRGEVGVPASAGLLCSEDRLKPVLQPPLSPEGRGE